MPHMKDQEVMTDYVAVIIPTDHVKRSKVFCGLTTKDIFNLAIHLILPLSLGMFTIVITFYQQKVTNQQRLEDRIIARIQREQDLNISAVQREQDKLIAQQQREEDELRRHQDLNISALQRDLDLRIAEAKRTADDTNAEKQRNMSQEQRQHELEVERTRFLDTLLLSYFNEIGELLEKGNGSLTRISTTTALARAKTLSVISQIDQLRSVAVIQFLQNTGQITVGENPLILSGASLNGINLSKSLQVSTLKKVSLAQTYLMNASFVNQDISNWDFSDAILVGANFRGSNCTDTIFNGANLIEADFSYSYLDNAIFDHADLTASTFTAASGIKIARYAKFQNVNFTDSNLISGTRAARVQFIDCNFIGSIFRRTTLAYVNFKYCDLTNANFDVAELHGVSFQGSTLVHAHLVNVYLTEVTFNFANFSYANLSGAKYCKSMGCQDPFKVYFYLWNTILPDNTRGPPHINILSNGQAQECNTSNGTRIWKIHGGLIINKAHYFHSQKCAFGPAHYLSTEVMSQLIYLVPLQLGSTTSLVSDGRARLVTQSSTGWWTGIYVDEYSNNVFLIRHIHQYQNESGGNGMEHPQYKTIESSVLLHKNTTHLNVTVDFTASRSEKYMWMEFIKVELLPVIYVP